jgi:hypothetical protein
MDGRPAAALPPNRRAAGQRRSYRRGAGGALISRSFNESVDRISPSVTAADPLRSRAVVAISRWRRQSDFQY